MGQRLQRLLRTLSDVRHHDPDVRRRGRVLIALCGTAVLIGLGMLPFALQLSDAPHGALTTLAIAAAFLAVIPLARSGRIGWAVAAMIGIQGSFLLASVALTNAQLAPVYASTIVLLGGLVVRARVVTLVLLGTMALIAVMPVVAAGGTRPSSYNDVVAAGLMLCVVAAGAAVITSHIMTVLLREAAAEGSRARDLADRLAEANARLEARVAARTEELEESLRRSRDLANQLEGLTRRDHLTGLGNRRELDVALQALDARAGRPDGLSLAVLDIDDFKRINDRYGHPAGDEVLRRMAAALDGGRRADDVIVRLGGEEFVLVLPGTDEAQAREACERLRACVAALSFDDVAPGLRVTTSVGVATGGPGPAFARLGALLGTADSHLYEAKRAGKDRVVGGLLEASRPAVVA